MLSGRNFQGGKSKRAPIVPLQHPNCAAAELLVCMTAPRKPKQDPLAEISVESLMLALKRHIMYLSSYSAQQRSSFEYKRCYALGFVHHPLCNELPDFVFVSEFLSDAMYSCWPQCLTQCPLPAACPSTLMPRQLPFQTAVP